MFQKRNSFPANEVSFVHLEAQMKCYLKHEHTNPRAVENVAEMNTQVRVRILPKPCFYLIKINKNFSKIKTNKMIHKSASK